MERRKILNTIAITALAIGGGACKSDFEKAKEDIRIKNRVILDAHEFESAAANRRESHIALLAHVATLKAEHGDELPLTPNGDVDLDAFGDSLDIPIPPRKEYDGRVCTAEETQAFIKDIPSPLEIQTPVDPSEPSCLHIIDLGNGSGSSAPALVWAYHESNEPVSLSILDSK